MQHGGVTSDAETVELSHDDLRAVARDAVPCAQGVLPLFTAVRPDDGRPHAAVDAARRFADGAPRTRLQRETAVAAHAAARQATTGAAAAAARSAGHAAAAAYLHPIARSTQVAHVLGAAAQAALARELDADGDPAVGAGALAEIAAAIGDDVVAVLRRYPSPAPGRTRGGALLADLDRLLRAR